MKIKKITFQKRNDFEAIFECEHCGNEELIKDCYDSTHFHTQIIPWYSCEKCGKNRAGEIEVKELTFSQIDKKINPIERPRQRIKLNQQLFEKVGNGEKPFEIRFNDSDYQQTQSVRLYEADDDGILTGRAIDATIGLISDFCQRKGYVVFGLLNIKVSA